MKEAISGAKSGGIGAATVSNCYHSGRLGSYVAQAADEGLIGIAMVNGGGGGQSVAPFGGAEPRLATNPLAIAAPQCDGFNLLLDFATSVVPEGKVRDLARRGEKLPEGCIVDHKGNPTTDPNDFYGPPQGSILPMGGNVGYKGFALGFMVDILAGALSGAGCCSKDETLARDGLLLLAIDPEHFSGAEYVRGQITALYQHIKSCRTAPGFEEVYTPGEIEHRMEQHRRLHGIPLDHATLDDLERISAELGLEWLLDSMTTAHTNGDAVDASPASRETTAK